MLFLFGLNLSGLQPLYSMDTQNFSAALCPSKEYLKLRHTQTLGDCGAAMLGGCSTQRLVSNKCNGVPAVRTGATLMGISGRLAVLLATACSQAWLEAAADVHAEIAADFFVSRGKYSWSGQLPDPVENNGPFATVPRAQKAVRVVLRQGTYYLDSPLEFCFEDSGTEIAPVVYAAAEGEKPV